MERAASPVKDGHRAVPGDERCFMKDGLWGRPFWVSCGNILRGSSCLHAPGARRGRIL